MPVFLFRLFARYAVVAVVRSLCGCSACLPVFFLLGFGTVFCAPAVRCAEERGGQEEWRPLTAPADWSITGEGKIDAGAAEGPALVLTRDPATLPATGAVSALHPLQAGVWQAAGSVTCNLYAPDMSFHMELAAEWFDAGGKSLGTTRILTWGGRETEKPFRQAVTSPDEAAGVRLLVRTEKSHGTFMLRGLRLLWQGVRQEQPGGDRVARFSCAAEGFLFYPQQERVIALSLTTPHTLPDGRVFWQVRDYWGNVCFRSGPDGVAAVAADKAEKEGEFRYRAEMDLSALPLREGKYYELQTQVTLAGAGQPATDSISFAVLPEAAANNYEAGAIPFGTHTWDARQKEYFELSRRLGLRRCLVFWHFDPGAPEGDLGFTPGTGKYNYTLGWPRKLGLRPYGMLYPVFDIERGKYEFEQGLGEGVRRSVALGRPLGLWGLQIGNEPPHWNAEMIRRDVAAYRVAYEAAKKADPDVFVIGSAIGPVEEFFQAGFQPWCDAYNIHAYSDLGELRAGMRKYRELFAKYGGAKPIYSTEIGSKSQGLSREQIAQDLLRKAVCFLADGGEFFTWFAITYPDPTGKRRGSYGDSMDLFAGYLNMYAPRLDAVAYYHLINNLLDKKFVQERKYDDGTQAFLFRNGAGVCLQALWNLGGKGRDILVALPATGAVKAVWPDGTTRYFDAQEEGIVLRVTSEPVLLVYQDAEGKLPDKLPAPVAQLAKTPVRFIPGEAAELVVALAGARGAEDLRLQLPVGWRQEGGAEALGEGRSRFRVVPDPESTAREAEVTVLIGQPGEPEQGALPLRLPLAERVEIKILPARARTAEGGDAPAVRLLLKNNTSAEQPLKWRLALLDETGMEGGKFDFPAAQRPTATFAFPAAGEMVLAGRQDKEMLLPLRDLDGLSLLTVRAAAETVRGVVTTERRLGGCARVPQLKAALNPEGYPAAEDWANAPELLLDQKRQYYHDHTMAEGSWEGPADLSGKLRFLWDKDNLYLRCAVTDDVFANPGKDGSLWRMDGLQLLIDPYRQESETKGRYDISLGLGQNGPQAYRHMSASPAAPTGLAPEIRVKVERGAGGNAEYVVALPWRSLAPFVPAAGANLGLSLIVNEDDGAGRCGFLAWFAGVHLKEVSQVGDLILEGAQQAGE